MVLIGILPMRATHFETIQDARKISKYRFYKDELKDMNAQKLFNYLLQNLETSLNVLILWDILKILRGKKTTLCLYVYDSFLLDVDEKELDVVEEIKKVFEKYKLNISENKGKTYGDLVG